MYAYIHTGIAISTGSFSCPWDSGQCGIIAVTKEKALKEYNRKKMSKKLQKTISERLTSEINTLDSFFKGEIYAYTITKNNENDETEPEFMDSCGGYYDKNDAIGEAEDMIKYYEKNQIPPLFNNLPITT